MAARTVARYQVGGHLLMVSAADGTDVRSLLPSYERFGVEDDGADSLVHVDVDPSRAMDKPEREVGQFDCGGCVHGVFLMPDDPTEILASLPVDEVWGVGRRLPAKLRAERILTAQHLRDAPDATIRSIGGVTLLNPGAAGRFGRSGYGVVTISGGTFECRLETDTE